MKFKSRLKQLILNSYGNKYAAKVLYGTILLFVALLGLNASGISSGYLAAAELFIALVAIIIAEDYAELIGFTIKNKRTLTKLERREIFEDTLAIATFCFPPVIILLISESGLYNLSTAFDFTFIYCTLIISIFGYWANRLSGYGRLRSLVRSSIASGVGIIIIYVKFFFGK